MPGPYLYPGVYVEEIASGVRPIAGVSTSDTAFVDFFARGPIDRAVRITSFADFERVFGGVDRRSAASYAIQQYYLNGGSVAWVVRLVPHTSRTADRMLTSVSVGGSGAGSGAGSGSGAGGTNVLLVEAISPGAWGNSIEVGVDTKGTLQAGGQPVEFNLVVREVAEVGGKQVVRTTEVFRNLNTTLGSPRFVNTVVNTESALVKVTDQGAGGIPGTTGADLVGEPAKGTWLRLGAGGGTSGTDGSGNPDLSPGGDLWKAAAGAAAILGQAWDESTTVSHAARNRGIFELERIAPFIFNLLCLPAAADLQNPKQVYDAAVTFCEARRAFLLADIPEGTDTVQDMVDWMSNSRPDTNYGAVYFPRLEIPDLRNGNRPRNVAASGTIAGIYARTDATRGIWKAPAGTDAGIRGATLTLKLTDAENAALNPLGANVLRNFPIFGNIVWGARTLDGADQQASEWKYIPVRRTALFIEESLAQGLKWVVFEPNDEPLWAQIRLNVGAFMQNLFRQGAFQGRTPREAYLVKCDSETITQSDINLGIVNILVGFAPLKPAEFVVLQIQQLAGQVAV